MAYGDIGAIIDSETWAAGNRYFPFISHATGNIYLVSDGWGFTIRSIPIDDEGNIGAVINTQAIEGGATSSSKFIRHIDGDIYAVAFAGAVNAKVVTFTCSAAGVLGGVIDTEDLSLTPANKSHFPFLLHATGNIFIVAYTDDQADGWIKTLTINNDGSIDPFLASWELEAAQGRFPWIVHVSGNTYAIIISSTGVNRGRLRTFTVDGLGAIGPITEWLFDGNVNAMNGGCIVPILGDTFAIFWQGLASVGQMATCTLDIAGNINGSTPGGPAIDTWNYDVGLIYIPFAAEVSGNAAGNGKIFCVGHGRDSSYQIWTLEIQNDGTILKTMIDTLILVAADWADSLSLVRVSGVDAVIFAAAYEELTGANSGEVDTFEVEGRRTPIVQTNPATGVT